MVRFSGWKISAFRNVLSLQTAQCAACSGAGADYEELRYSWTGRCVIFCRKYAAAGNAIPALRQPVISDNFGATVTKMPDDNKSNDEDKNPKKGGEFRVPPRTWIVWIAIFGGIILLMLFRDRMETTGDVLTQYQFFQKVESNQIVRATINYSPQSPLLTDISGKYYKEEGGHRVEAPFRTKARLTEAMENKILALENFEVKEPNTMLLSVVWSVLPIIIIATLIWFFFIRQIKMAGKGALSFGKS